MQTVKVNLKENSYEVIVGLKSLTNVATYFKKLNISRRGIIITDENVNKLYADPVEKSLKKNGFTINTYVIPAGEKSKNLNLTAKIYNFLSEKGIERKSFIIALGGGVVGDLAGFIASTYKRGIPFIQIPTTLLAQVDSSVGGKVAVNIPHGKNSVGTFYQPKIVLINFEVLKTLPKQEISNGLAEIIKYGIIKDRKLFAYLEKNMAAVFSHNQKILETIVVRSVQIKAAVVKQDEKENGPREILNFGHTVGHCLEEIYHYKNMSHGAAVGIGSIVAAVISANEKMIPQNTVLKIKALLEKASLATTFDKKIINKIINFLKFDKKVQQGKNKFVLINKQIGTVTFGNEINNQKVQIALNKTLMLP